MKRKILLIAYLVFTANLGFAQFDLLNTFVKKGHKVIDVKFSPDGNYIASCGMDKSIIIHDMQGNIVKILKNKKLIKCIAFSTDSKYLIAAGEDKIVTIWDYKNATIRFSLDGHKKTISAISVSKKGLIATLSLGNEIMVWDGNKGELIKTINPKTKGHNSIDFNADGETFVTGTNNGNITIWEAETGAVLDKIEKVGHGLKNVKFSDNGTFIVCSVNNDVKIWGVKNGLLERVIENVHLQAIESIDISNDGQYILCSSFDKKFSIWNMNKAKVFKSERQKNAVLNASFSKNGKYIVTCDYTNEIKIWDASSLNIKYVNKKINIGNTDNKPPKIIVSTPGIKKGFKQVVKKEIITISGKIKDDSEIMIAFINGTEIKLSKNGEFAKTLFLEKGENLITIKAIDVYNNKADEQFIVKLQTGLSPLNAQINEEQMAEGLFYALIIGVSEYDDASIMDLADRPINDAEKLAEILIYNYIFDEENVEILLNPTRRDILVSFDNLARSLTDEDNLLIFYAGHGYYEEENDIGYWLPSDSEINFTANWIYNNNTVDLLKKIKTKHTLLISDACFSGSIFRGRDANLLKGSERVYKNMYKLKSRNAMTSGALKTVPNKSMFFEYLAKSLSNNVNPFMSSRELFNKIQKNVGNYTQNVPQWGDIPGIGDAGGDFIFIKRK